MPVGHGAAGVGGEIDHAADVRHLERVIERVDVLGQDRVGPARALGQLGDDEEMPTELATLRIRVSIAVPSVRSWFDNVRNATVDSGTKTGRSQSLG